MKTFAHLAGIALAAVLAGLASGCASTPKQARYVQPATNFEVVENSANRPLTENELAEVRAAVAAYLEREGATDSGDYYVKVFLTPASVDADPEWVVVRFTRYTAERVVLAGDPGYGGPLYAPYYAYDVYPYGYDSISRISFQYYVDPYYGHHYPYYPHHGSGGGHDDHHHDHDTANHHDHDTGNHHDHDGQPGNPPDNGQHQGSRPPPKYYGNRPGVPQNQPPRSGDTARKDDRHDGSPRQGGGRADGRSHSSDTADSGNRPVPPRPVQSTATDQGGRPAYSAASHQRPELRTAPVQEARREPPTSRPAPVYRSPSSEPARSYQPAPERSAPPPASSGSSNNGDHRAGESIKQDAVR
jgi:hypothetical protein